MSVFIPLSVACPACGEPVEFRSVLSVNADRRPDLRDEILAGSFQREACPACGTAFRMAPEFTCIDTGRGQLLVVRPLSELPHWEAHEAAAQALFERGYGPRAAPLAREIGARLQLRLVFGWAALEEKLRAADAGLDDVQLELLKAALVRVAAAPAFSDERELRLVASDGTHLTLAWLAPGNGAVFEDMQVPRQAYLDIATQAEWQPLRAELAAHAFVDLNRLFLVEA